MDYDYTLDGRSVERLKSVESFQAECNGGQEPVDEGLHQARRLALTVIRQALLDLGHWC